MGKASIVRTEQGVRESLSQALDLIGGLASYISRQDRVLLKPNLNGAEVYTDKELVGGLIEMLRDLGAGRIFIAESSFGNAATTRMFFEKTGYTELARRYGVDLVNLNASRAVEVPVADPLRLDTIRIAEEVYEADRIVNLPSMKVHYATGVSLALKNLKGFLVGDEKRHFHTVGLDDAIVDLNHAVRVDLNIIDCITAMERMGPHGGDPVAMNLLIAGADRAEVDFVGCQVMGYSLGEVKHLERYVAVNSIDLGAVEVVGESIAAVRHPLKKVALEEIIPEGFTVHSADACSTCMSAFLIARRFLKGKPPRPGGLYMGSPTDGDARSAGISVAFGNCCARRLAADRVVRGCPPYPFILGEVLEGVLE
jgi:uncharacterized protein (DUF362 family)